MAKLAYVLYAEGVELGLRARVYYNHQFADPKEIGRGIKKEFEQEVAKRLSGGFSVRIKAFPSDLAEKMIAANS